MLTGFILAAASAAAQSAPATAAATSAPQGPSLMQDLINGAMIAWFVLAIVALIKTQVFASRPLLKAPGRAATALLPVAFGTVVVFYSVLVVAFGIGYAAGLLPKPVRAGTAATMTQPATTSTTASTSAPATSTLPAAETAASQATTATAATAATAPEADAAGETKMVLPELTPLQEMWKDLLGMSAEIFAVGVALLFCNMLFREGLRGMGFTIRGVPRGVMLGILAFLILYPLLQFDFDVVLWIYANVGHKISVHPTIQAMENLAAGPEPSFSLRLVAALVAGVGAPVVEELFFRGIVQTALIQPGWGFAISFPADRALRSTYSPPPPTYQRWVAIVLTSLLFCQVHQGDQAPILFLLSMGLGYTYERTGNLWASITIHAIFNWMTLVPLLFPGTG